MAIVRNLKQFKAAVLDKDLQGGRACVDSVLRELLERMNRGDDDLAGGDLVDDILMQRLSSVISGVV